MRFSPRATVLDASVLAQEPFVRFSVTDIDGVFRGKHLSGEKAAALLSGGGADKKFHRTSLNIG
jgi:hypothetical protein